MWCVIAAAGSGRRFGAERPKQYVELLGRPLIDWTLERIAAHPSVSGLMLVLAAGDRHWRAREAVLDKPLCTTAGGAERAESVLAGLRALPGEVGARDWVLVHDAARPCVRHVDLDRLLEVGRRSAHGALLGAPLRDTLKRAGARSESAATIPREGLWRAYTPQMGRRGELERALYEALENAASTVTDEASALERLGFFPLLVEGCDDNLKLTSDTDLALIEAVLGRQLGLR